MKFGTLVVQTLKFIKMSKLITLKSIAFRWRPFKVNICCAYHKPVAQHGHISSPRSLHPGTSPEKPDRDSKRNGIKCPRSPTNIGADSQKPSPWKRLTRQTSLLWRSTETSVSTCKGPMVQQSKGLGPAKLEASLDGRTRVYRPRNERFAMNCVLEVDNFGEGSVMMWSPISYAEKLNWCTPTATLAPLDTEMRFWHHTCFPQWTSVGKFFSKTTLGCTQLVLLLTF